jgi:hypothetical protein
MAVLTTEANLRAQVVALRGAAPVLLFAYFHTVFRSERRKLLLAKKRFAAQIVETIVETAKPPLQPTGGGQAPMWRAQRVQVPAFSHGVRQRQNRPTTDEDKALLPARRGPRGRELPTTTVIAMGSWGGNAGMRGMQRAAGGFARKDIEHRVQAAMMRHYRNVYHCVVDEYLSSKPLGKLRVALLQKRVDKWNPNAGTKAYVRRADGSAGTFQVAEDKAHKLLAFSWQVPGEQEPRIVTTNRDEPTTYSYTQILVHDLLGVERPFHLSRKSTFQGARAQTSQTSGRGQMAMK